MEYKNDLELVVIFPKHSCSLSFDVARGCLVTNEATHLVILIVLEVENRCPMMIGPSHQSFWFINSVLGMYLVWIIFVLGQLNIYD